MLQMSLELFNAKEIEFPVVASCSIAEKRPSLGMSTVDSSKASWKLSRLGNVMLQH